MKRISKHIKHCRKTVFLFMFVLLFLTSTSMYGSAQDTTSGNWKRIELGNAGFESEPVEENLPAEWSLLYGRGGFQVSKDMSYKGEQSLFLNGSKANQNFGIQSEYIPVEVGEMYSASELVMNKEIRSIDWRKMLVTMIMALIGISFILPFVWMISSSMKREIDVFTFPIEWIPSIFNGAENFKAVWLGKFPFYLFYLNTIKVTVITTITSTIVSCMAAYGFSKIQFNGKTLLFFIVLATYMVPSQTLLVPQFILYRQFGLFDTHTGLIILNSFSVLGTFLLRQFFISVSSEYIEAAKIDGAKHFTIFTRIMLPIVRPAIATYMILRFIWTWNDYQNPLIFLRSEKLFTLQLGLTKFADEFGQSYSLVMAAAVSGIIPLLIIFIFGQRHVIEGISLGGVKG